MKIEDAKKQLNLIQKQTFSLDDLNNKLQSLKIDCVKADNQAQAKDIWILQTIIQIHIEYRAAFNLLKSKKYFDGWRQLEQIEIITSSLKKHFQYDKEQYCLWHIEKSVKNLQVIFPYKIFASTEILKKKKKCSVCDKEVSIRKPCGHITGEIYDGEMCYRIVTEAEIMGISLVENPGNKYSVMFLKDETTDEEIDQYDYTSVDYLFDHIESPYEEWNLEVLQMKIRKEHYGDIGRNEKCSCGSNKKFKKCCSNNIGKYYPHYKFVLKNPSKKMILTNTLKK
tara:strand:+ start:4160 stop:5005 length:846 start_codon:yes stop_codon:yes gene_type:complete